MLSKVKGIVLHSVKHQDNNLIVYLYTNTYGRQTYIAKGVRSVKSKNRANLFQPLFLLDIEVSHHERANVQTLRECKLAQPFHTISVDVHKSAIALFIGELLYKVIREEEDVNANLFNFLYHSICMLDEIGEGAANFHLHFMVQLARYLGFAPSGDNDDAYFDIKAGEFTPLKPVHPQYFDITSSQILAQLQQLSASDIHQLKLNRADRYTFLDNMVDFYSFHFDRILPIHSLDILREVFA